MKASEIEQIISPLRSEIAFPESTVVNLLIDSRRFFGAEGTLFFAIPTARNNGCNFIDELYGRGVRNFVVPKDYRGSCTDVNIWYVDDVVAAMQRLAAYRRSQYSIPVVGITGSNGKTIVKDWFTQMVCEDMKVTSSPNSYNSQIGVPLSVWQLEASTELAVFEAGISEKGEMDRLERVIRPTIGVLTNLGQAHDENFASRKEKLAEKLRLFRNSNTLIYSGDDNVVASEIDSSEDLKNVAKFTWGRGDDCDVKVRSVSVVGGESKISVVCGNEDFVLTIPFTDKASLENVMHCVSLMLLVGYKGHQIVERCAKLRPLEMRLEMMDAVNDCMLVNDSYSLDLSSLSIALDYLDHVARDRNKTLIISDFVHSEGDATGLYRQLAYLVHQHKINKLIAVGEDVRRNQHLFDGVAMAVYPTTQDLLHQCSLDVFSGEAILLKGARVYGFEQVAHWLQRQSHETEMQVDLSAMISNLNYYRSQLRPTTRLMAMVKASAYGTGTVDVANALQYHRVDYLTVAYIDEGVVLRQGGISLPIMVMNPEPVGFDDMLHYHLEPDIYSFRILKQFAERARLMSQEKVNVHIEYDSGMHRLGFGDGDMDQLVSILAESKDILSVRSVFSHLACADDPSLDGFTHNQLSRFDKWSSDLVARVAELQDGDRPLRHILNSAGIERFADYQMDMVRLGIGLYGITSNPGVKNSLKEVSRLVTRVSQLKDIPAGDSVGYSMGWIAKRDSRIAIIPIGYADGWNRHLGREHGHVMINGQVAPIIGNVCMDMCFVDVTDIDHVQEGDEVILFGDGDLLEQNASAADTIPYELLTAVAPRVKRVYLQE